MTIACAFRTVLPDFTDKIQPTFVNPVPLTVPNVLPLISAWFVQMERLQMGTVTIPHLLAQIPANTVKAHNVLNAIVDFT